MHTSQTAPRLGKELGDVQESTLRFFAQLGVEVVGIPRRMDLPGGTNPTARPLVPPPQAGPPGAQSPIWDEAELSRVCERVRQFGLEPWLTTLSLSANIVLGHPNRDADLEIVKTNIRIAGRLGLRVLTYNFMALRPSEGYRARYGHGRGGAHYRDFDARRIADLPPLPQVGTHTETEQWDRLRYFLEAVIPTAEAAGIRLAVHPNDPPVATFRGVDQPLHSLDRLKKLVDVVDSPANSIYLDTGVTTEMGEDAVAAIHYFGQRDRIGTVHFRNVQVMEPSTHYVETFHDNGDADLFACMKAFYEVGYTGMIDPDHTPYLTSDTPDTRAGWAFALGQILTMHRVAGQLRQG